MVWGTAPVYGHLGLDLTGPNGGVVRIDDIVIEDVTEVFHRKMMDWVDVRDYGALGDGVTDDARGLRGGRPGGGGRGVLVSAGNYYLGSNVTFESRVRFEGTLTMPAAVAADLHAQLQPRYLCGGLRRRTGGVPQGVAGAVLLHRPCRRWT